MGGRFGGTLAGVCLAGFLASPAAAITMQAVYTGTVVQSDFVGEGAFGVGSGETVDGLSAEFVFVFDPLDAPIQILREERPGEFVRIALGDWPAATGWVTINGVTERIPPGGEWNTRYVKSALTGEGSGIVHEVGESHSVGGLGETNLLASATSLGSAEFWQPLTGSIPPTVLGSPERYGIGVFYSFQRYENMDVRRSWYVETRWQSVQVSPVIAPVPAPPAWLLLASGLVAVSGAAGWARRAPSAGGSAL